MARKFFYVCASILLLVVAFGLGAVSVTAQQGETTLSVAGFTWISGLQVGAIANRVLIYGGFSPWNGRHYYSPYGVTSPIPGTSPVVGVNSTERVVVLANGEVYQYVDGGWELVGNMLEGVVGVSQTATPSKLGVSVTPNPTRGAIRVGYSLDEPADVTVEVHDVQGRKVAERVLVGQPPGRRLTELSLDDQGNELGPGTYFVRVRAGSQVATQKSVVTR